MQRIVILYFTLLALSMQAADDYALKASHCPLAFALVREDSLQDQEIIKRYFPEKEIDMAMIASGGCTAALLAAQAPLRSLTLIDPNSAQIALTKLKLQLLSLPSHKRAAILGHQAMDATQRRTIINGYLYALDIDPTTLGDEESIAQHGIDHEGRYEKVFQALRDELAPYRNQLLVLFQARTPEEQIAMLDEQSQLGRALDSALDKVMSQANLVALFGEKATANRVQDFSRHFAHRIRTYIAHHLASNSAWLAHMLLGHFYDHTSFPWLTATPIRPMPSINYYQGLMNDFLISNDTKYDVIHLSNILDWLNPEEAQQTLRLAYKALRPGGLVVIRQLNSTLNIVDLGSDFTWHEQTAQEFLKNDRSFFYRNFFIGQKPKKSLAPCVIREANEILTKIPLFTGEFFKDLPTMNKETFQKIQEQFFFAVDYFSLPMAALVARLPKHEERIDIIHNIVEEHGNFNPAAYHSNTFKQFLSTLGVTTERMATLLPSMPVTSFNQMLMELCSNQDTTIAIACLGMIEYAFADISSIIAREVVHHGWIKSEELVHYNLHADLDKEHAEEFFKIIEPDMDISQHAEKVYTGLFLGATIFNMLYQELYNEAKN